jgi:uncharacterized protein YjbI with pentapeptide repeats
MRMRNPKLRPTLVGVSLVGLHLAGVNLGDADLRGAHIEKCALRNALFGNACLQHSLFCNIEDASHARFTNADMSHCVFRKCTGPAVHFTGAELRAIKFLSCQLRESCFLERPVLAGAIFRGCDLQRACFKDADLRGVRVVGGTDMRGTVVHLCMCDSTTLFDFATGNSIDRNTDLGGTPYETARLQPGVRQILDWNIRRKRWGLLRPNGLRLGLRAKKVLGRIFAAPFLWLSDYGMSTLRVLMFFLMFSLLFANIYYHVDDILLPDIASRTHALYFSVVTMTTLGFGDIHADSRSALGMWVVMCNVFMGYVVLGALVTRLSILWATDGQPKWEVYKRSFLWG